MHKLCQIIFVEVTLTAPFNNMRTLKFQAQPTNAFFATVNQMLAGSSPAFDCCRACGDQIVVQSSDNEQSSAVVVSWEEPPNTWLTAAQNAFVGRAFNFRVRVFLKSAVKITSPPKSYNSKSNKNFHLPWFSLSKYFLTHVDSERFPIITDE